MTTATDVDTSLEFFTALTESLNQAPPCDIGRVGNPPPGIEPCPNPADFSCRVHQCGVPDGVLLLCCTDHISGIIGRLSEHLGIGGGFYVEACGHVVRRVDDFIWDITPLR